MDLGETVAMFVEQLFQIIYNLTYINGNREEDEDMHKLQSKFTNKVGQNELNNEHYRTLAIFKTVE